MICAKCEWIVSPLDDKARRADHFCRSIERASAHRPNGGLGGAHHALHRGMLPVLDLDPVQRTTAAIGPIASFRHQAF
jgi:hypothetical protein